MTLRHFAFIAGAGLTTVLCSASPALAQSLGAASSFAVEGQAGVTAAGPAGTVINGDVGSSPNASITGFPPAIVTPPYGVHRNDASAIAAQAAAGALYTTLGAGACTNNPIPQMNGVAFGPGIHCFATTADLAGPGNMTLTGAGVYIFRVPTGLTANVGSTVTLIGVDPCTVFWQVGSAAILNGTNFVGNVVAQAGVTLGAGGASLAGRALATAGPVTLSGGNTIGGCSTAAAAFPTPSLTKSFNPVSVAPNGVTTLTLTLLNPGIAAAALTGPLTDTLPDGLTVASTPAASTTCGGVVSAVAGGNSFTLTGGAIPAGTGAGSGSCTVTVNIAANGTGTHINVIAAGALQTSNGPNAAAAIATVTVVSPISGTAPTLAKQFNPPAIVAGGISRLVITLLNPNSSAATLNVVFTDTLPGGVVVAPTPNASTTCGGSGDVIAAAGTNTVSLPTTRSVPAGSPGSCTISVDVRAPGIGNFINTIPANALNTSNGNNAGASVATLAVTALGPIPPVPTLSQWGMIVLTSLLALGGFLALRRRNT